jgi:two-component system response regulator HydG
MASAPRSPCAPRSRGTTSATGGEPAVGCTSCKAWSCPRPGPTRPHFVEALWHDSYEAEQHLIHVGRCDHPVCWAQCGFTTGYLSYVNQREILRARGAVPRAGRRGLPHDRQAARGLGRRAGRAPAVLRRVGRRPRPGAGQRRRGAQGHRAAAAPTAAGAGRRRGTTRRRDRAQPGDAARAGDRRAGGAGSTPPCSSRARAASARSASPGSIHDAVAPRGATPSSPINCGADDRDPPGQRALRPQPAAPSPAPPPGPPGALRVGPAAARSSSTRWGSSSPAMQVKPPAGAPGARGAPGGRAARARRVDVRDASPQRNRNLADEVAAGAVPSKTFTIASASWRCVSRRCAPDAPDDLVPLARAAARARSPRDFKRPVTEPVTPEAADMLTAVPLAGQRARARKRPGARRRCSPKAPVSRRCDDLPEEVHRRRGCQRRCRRAMVTARWPRGGAGVHPRGARGPTAGNQTQTAAQLGIGTATLYRKLAAYRAADRAPARRRKPR